MQPQYRRPISRTGSMYVCAHPYSSVPRPCSGDHSHAPACIFPPLSCPQLRWQRHQPHSPPATHPGIAPKSELSPPLSSSHPITMGSPSLNISQTHLLPHFTLPPPSPLPPQRKGLSCLLSSGLACSPPPPTLHTVAIRATFPSPQSDLHLKPFQEAWPSRM